MTTKETEVMTELIILADSEFEDKQKQDGGYTVQAINNVSAFVEQSTSLNYHSCVLTFLKMC